jgi:hypothetical protein
MDIWALALDHFDALQENESPFPSSKRGQDALNL